MGLHQANPIKPPSPTLTPPPRNPALPRDSGPAQIPCPFLLSPPPARLLPKHLAWRPKWAERLWGLEVAA